MSSKKSNKYDKRPFIVPLMQYVFGVAEIILAIWLTIKIFQNPNDDGIIGTIAFIILILFISGLGILSIVVGYRRRKW